MSYRSGVITGAIATLIICVAGYVGWQMLIAKPVESGKSSASTVPATVPKPLKEDQINTVILTSDAEQRLAIKTASIEKKTVRRARSYGGELTLPPGQTILVAAPLSGILQIAKGDFPKPGQIVRKGQLLFEFLPLVTPEGRANLAASKVDAEGQVKNAQSQFDASKIALDRAKQLLRDEAGSRRMVDEAQAAYDLAQKMLEAAVARRDLLLKIVGEIENGTTAPIAIRSPDSGLLRNVNAVPGQSVPAGAALFEIIDPSRMWIRVPIYVGDLPELDTNSAVTIRPLSSKPTDLGQIAKPVVAPPSANAIAGTVDLFYELDNRDAKYSPAHRVSVTVPLTDSKESLTISRSAIVYDIHGGTWVYEQTVEHTFVRRRVTIRYVQGDFVMLADGPKVNSTIIVAGAAELFGTETGFSK